jgi:hypothetical protein
MVVFVPLKSGSFKMYETKTELKKEAYEKPELAKEGHLKDITGQKTITS